MGELHVGLVPRGTIGDVYICTLASFSDEWITPCTPTITEDGTLIHDKNEPYVIELSKNDPLGFRDINWKQRWPSLHSILSRTDLKIWIGCYSLDQLLYLKEMFPDCKTHSIVYREEHKKTIAENLYKVADHFHLLHPDITISFLIDQLEVNDYQDADHVIDFDDIYSTNLVDIIEQFDGPRNEQQKQYHKNWLALNTSSKVE